MDRTKDQIDQMIEEAVMDITKSAINRMEEVIKMIRPATTGRKLEFARNSTIALEPMLVDIIEEAITVDTIDTGIGVYIHKDNKFELPTYGTVGSSGVDLQADILEMKTSKYLEVCRKLNILNSNDVIVQPIVTATEIKLILGIGQRAIIPTNIKVAIPEGYEIQIRPRSGNAIKYGLTVVNTPGTIDSDYRGQIMVIVSNNSCNAMEIPHGMKIAQAVLCKVEKIAWLRVSSDEDLPETVRADGGFGHTDKP